MRNIIYVSLIAIELTACNAVTPKQHNNPHYAQQGHGAYYQQQPATAQYNNSQYNAAQYGPAQHYTQNTQNTYQAPNYAQNYGYNPQGYAPAYSAQQSTQKPPLRGPHRALNIPGYFYGTLGLVNYDTDIDNYGIEGRLGYQATKHFGVEAEGSIGISDDEFTTGNLTVSSGFNGNIAAFGVARLPVTDRIALHARGGYDFRSYDNEIRNSAGASLSNSGNLDGFAYGVGGEYALSPRNRLRVDYTLYESDLGTSDAFSVSYKRKF